MTYQVKPAPSFLRDAKMLLKRFPQMSAVLSRYLSGLESSGPQGNLIPRYTMLWKDRIAMPPYKIGKSGGWRIIVLESREEGILVPLLLYYKKDMANISTADIQDAIRELERMI